MFLILNTEPKYSPKVLSKVLGKKSYRAFKLLKEEETKIPNIYITWLIAEGEHHLKHVKFVKKKKNRMLN